MEIKKRASLHETNRFIYESSLDFNLNLIVRFAITRFAFKLFEMRSNLIGFVVVGRWIKELSV